MAKSSLLLTLTLIICSALSIKATSPPGTCTATANNEPESNNLVPERREVYGGGRIFDISHQYTANMPSWASTEGLGQFLWLTKSMKNGPEANFSEMKMPTHTGTHVDAPGHVFDHYFNAGFDVDTLDLESIVRYLPGFTGPLPFELETGYIGLDDSDDVQLFYYFIKSERNPSEDPLMLWLTGGPGCSALTGLAFEIGPLYFKKIEYNGSLPTLELNPNSWTKWFVKHPEFLANPFYVAGDSWSGFTIPIVAQHISDGIEAGHKPPINLKGYLLGNPGTDKALETNSKIPFLHGMGIISDELYESAKKSCKGDYANVHPSNAQCNKDLQAVLELTSRINQPHILEPFNLLLVPKSQQITKERRALHENSSKLIISMPEVPDFQTRAYGYYLSYYWANNEDVQKALNVQKGTVGEWIRCNWDLPITKDVQNSVDYHRLLSKRNYRSLIYSGDHDLMVPFISTQAWIRSLNYSIIDEWRPWFVNGQVAGYTRTYSNNMTFATVKGGGHTAPEYRPEECLAMFMRWLSCDHL